ncbi:hypothetical protein DFH09DRAFT_1149565 [Mycena vulgaris]|nr:hypothetical protein DFH09DRAFT_1149565 [Mycena vulgaris]
MYLYGFGTTFAAMSLDTVAAMYVQLSPAVLSTMALQPIYRLCKYTRRTDTTVYSRVNMHHGTLVLYSVSLGGISGMY